MNVTETSTEGLRHEFQVTVPLNELDAKVNERLDELKDKVRINGFRPGKVPVAHLKRVYGRAAMAEAIEAMVREANAKIVTDRGFKLASEPKVTLPTEQSQVEELIAGKADLSYTVAIEVVPTIELADFKTLQLDRWVADVGDAEIDEALGRIARENRPFQAKGESAKAEKDDRVVISFVGRIDGEPFEGGAGEDVAVHLGSGTFIPGFEDQLIGIAAGETRTLKVTFPANYMQQQLAGKDAEFEVTAKSIETPNEVKLDDDFAKGLGLESFDKLKDAIKDRLQRENVAAARQRLKRQLLDQLDEKHKFEAPPSLIEEEFQNVWRTVNDDLKAQGRTFADEGTTEEAAQADYRKIAERRVRLGLVLAEIGERNGIKVTDDELSRAAVERVRQFPPERQQEVWNFYRNNANALQGLRAPIFEEKVVDFLSELAQVTEKKVSREELYRDDDQAAPAA
jgi:trigger factor